MSKIHAAQLKITRNLHLLNSFNKTGGHDRELESSALSLTSLKTLVRGAAFLDGTSEAQYLAAHDNIRRQLRKAMARTLRAAPFEAEAARASRLSSRAPHHYSFANALRAAWSLCSVLVSPAATASDRAYAIGTLTTIGELARIPRALGIVRPRQPCQSRYKADRSCR